MSGSTIRCAILLAAVVLGGCSGLRRDGARPPVSDVAAAVAVDAYRSFLDMGEVLLIRAPKVFLLDLPVWLFYEGPRSLFLQASSARTQVESLMGTLEDGDSEEARFEAVTKLREVTGLPLGDAAAWKAWWRAARDRPEESWRADFVGNCLAGLDDEDFLVRQEADDRLRELSGEDLEFDAKAPEEERAEPVRRWRAWAARDREGSGR